MNRARLFAVAVFVALAACGQDRGQLGSPVTLADGSYRALGGAGYADADAPRLMAVTAVLDRAGGRLVLTLGDGSQKVLTFTPRPKEGWQPDCFTMASHSVDEVADLSPAPLQVDTLTFTTPLVFAKCDPGHLILADASAGETAPWLGFALQ
jgi:hypothetical protein